jgi:hypothetical protein
MKSASTPFFAQPICSRNLRATTLAVAALLLSHTRANALVFQFDYTYDTNNFFDTGTANGLAARDRLTQAGNFFTSFTDNLTAISPGDSNTWTAIFSHPGTGASQSVSDLSIAVDTLLIYAGGRDLPGTALGFGGSGGFNASGDLAFLDSITRGQGTTSGTTATDFGPWGGSIAFDTLVNWNFSSASPGATENDFLSVAIHELGHALGIGTAASWDNLISGTAFIGSVSTTVYGSNPPLEADGFHWAEGTTSVVPSTGESQEVAMDPTIITGTRKSFTRLDYAGLKDLGWEVDADLIAAPVPFEVKPSFLIALLAGLVLGCRTWQNMAKRSH